MAKVKRWNLCELNSPNSVSFWICSKTKENLSGKKDGSEQEKDPSALRCAEREFARLR